MKVVIVDDELDSIELISELINIFFPTSFKIVGKAQNIIDAKEIINIQKPDLLFLDIEMPNGTGFDLLRSIPTNDLSVIFISGYNQYAIDTFKFNTLDYILKPISPAEFKKALGKALEKEKTTIPLTEILNFYANQKSKESKIVVPTLNGFEFLSVNEIAYCKADNKYACLFDKDNNQSLITKSIGDFEELLQNFEFFRVHKTFLVNRDFLLRYNKNENTILLTNGTTLPVSTRRKDEFLAWILT